MSKPKRHHYIPKSYLKNFALNREDKFFVEAKLITEETVKPDLISIVDICVGKNLYTIPNVDGDDKYAIERYYASEIDAVFPDIYELLVNEKVYELTDNQRRKVVLATLSLFFRTPKFLNLNAKYLDDIVSHAVQHHMDAEGRVTFNHDLYNLDFHSSQIGQIKDDLKLQNKITFLDNHMKDLHEFVEYKLKAGMMIITITGEGNLITSDNPVIIRSNVNPVFSLFDPTNIINVPIDNKHYLMIAPNSEDALLNKVFRSTHYDIMFVLTNNLQVEQNAESWIFGKPGTVKDHLDDQIKYNALTAENIQHVADLEAKSKNYVKLCEMIDEFGITDQHVISFIEKLLEDPLHKDDPNIREDYNQLKKLGWVK